jgi:hypothetical protein
MDESTAPSNTPSQEKVMPNLSYETKGDDRLLTVLTKKVEEMEREIHDLKVKKILEETSLPEEMLEANGLLPSQPQKLKRGRGYRPLLRSEIEEAKKHSIFGAQQAKYLGVAISTYKKYAKMHGLWEPRPDSKGKKRTPDPNSGKYPLNQILNGDFNGNPAVNDWMVKKKLFRNQTFPLECAICGYNKTRFGSEWPILLVDHMDEDRTNFKKENIRLLCLNCTAECGRGYWTRGFRSFDPDWKPALT